MTKPILTLTLTACLCLSLAGCFRKTTAAEPTTVPAETIVESTVISLPAETIVESTVISLPAETEPTEPKLIPLPEPGEEAFVPVMKYLPGAHLDLKYASSDNFTGQQIYEFRDVYLRYGTVKKLQNVQEELKSIGLALKIWDGFRPVLAQHQLWAVCPDPTYVANPETGFSSHSRGNTVDITLVDADGKELEMPTCFDDFSALADRDYSDCTQAAADHAMLLQKLMEKHGFSGYFGEWWHFSDTDQYPVEDTFLPVYRPGAYINEYADIILRTQPDAESSVITDIPVGGEYHLLAWHGDYVMVDYGGVWGYIPIGDLPAID